MRPILLNSCARAATAVEARFRIDTPQPGPRSSRVVALDEGAAAVVRRVASHTRAAAHFLAYEAGTPVVQGNGDMPDVALRAVDGSQVQLRAELTDADLVLMVATADDGAAAAAAIGEACTLLGVMTAGVVFGGERQAAAAVTALRPYARVLLVSRDEEDVPAILAALRA